MRKKFFFIISIVALFFLATSCKKNNAEVVSGSPAESLPAYNSNQTSTCTSITDTTRTTTHANKALGFNSLKEYKNKLKTIKSEEAICETFFESAEHPTDFTNNFDMLLIDRYFLVPIVPSTGSLSKASIYEYGESEFKITLSNGEKIFFVYRHHKGAPGEIKNATRTMITNSRSINIVHDHVYSATQDVHYGFYTWQEGDYYCRLVYEGNNIAVYDAFLKELSFEKVLLDG